MTTGPAMSSIQCTCGASARSVDQARPLSGPTHPQNAMPTRFLQTARALGRNLAGLAMQAPIQRIGGLEGLVVGQPVAAHRHRRTLLSQGINIHRALQ